MSQGEHYKTLLSLMKDLRNRRESMAIGVNADPLSAILSQPKNAEDSFDKVITTAGKGFQSQKEDTQVENVSSEQPQQSNTSTKLDGEILRFNSAASGSGKIQNVGETLNTASLDKQQKVVDLIPKYGNDNLIMHAEPHFLYRLVLNHMDNGHYETAKTICEARLEDLIKRSKEDENDLEISCYFEFLAVVYRERKKHDDAIILLSEAFDIYKEVFGHYYPKAP